MFENPDVSGLLSLDAVTLNARHFIQMWQHLKRALEEFAQIKLKSMFMPRGCRVLHLKIRRPSAVRLSLVPALSLSQNPYTSRHVTVCRPFVGEECA